MQKEQLDEIMDYKFDCGSKEELKILIDRFIILLDELEKDTVGMANRFSDNNALAQAATLVYFQEVIWKNLLQKYNECLAKAREISVSNKVIADAQTLPKYVDPFNHEQMAADGPKYVKTVKHRLQKLVKVLQGDSKIKSIDKDDGCFIATATMGNGNNPVVCTLREFRDEHLLRTKPGRIGVDIYYRYSPRLASIITRHSILRKLSYFLLI